MTVGETVNTLVVDDDEDMRLLVSMTITRANNGLRVVGEAGSGEEALVRWRDLEPSVVVLDQRMPGMSGLEVAARMLAEKPKQAIILFSAYLRPDDIEAARDLGVSACVAKTDLAGVPSAVRAAVA